MAIQAYDYKLDSDGDFDFTGGDFNIVESSVEHLNAIVLSVTGDYVLQPQLGVNLNRYINSPLNNSTIELQRIMSDNLKLDGFSTNKFTVSGDLSKDELNIDSSAIRIR